VRGFNGNALVQRSKISRYEHTCPFIESPIYTLELLAVTHTVISPQVQSPYNLPQVIEGSGDTRNAVKCMPNPTPR